MNMARSHSVTGGLFSIVAAILLAGGMLLLEPAPVKAQQFGKNKVQYRNFEWKYIQSDNFDIYFYDTAGIYLAKFTAHVAEDALRSIQDHWRYRITDRITIVLYHSHNDFQQTNVVGQYMPEGVGGVTELFKNRVVVPFEGDWEKFRHVIHHELVHAVINDKFYGGSIQSLISNNVRFMLPLWMNEGLAEFESHDGYDIETDMFIRDAVIGGYLPPLQYLDGYFAYRGGQAFYWYVEQTYGRDKISELLNRAKASGSLDAAFKGAFGKNVEEFSEQWLYDLKKIYWPDVADRKRPVDFSINLTEHRKNETYFNTSPSISPNGDKLAYISDYDGHRSVYVMDIMTREFKKLVAGENDVNFEELHLLTPAIAWSPDSRRIAIAVKSKGADAIFLIDVEDADQEKIAFDLDAIYSVDWSPDGSKLAFMGIKGDHSDIYTYDLGSKGLSNLTEDIFSDSEPNWAPDSRTIYFLSDRGENPIRSSSRDNLLIWNYDYNRRDIYSIDSESLALDRVTTTDNALELSPVPGPNGELIFVSNRNGINNIYLQDATGEVRPLTNSISGIDQLSLSRDASKLVYTAWNGDGYDIFMMRMPFESRVDSSDLAPTKYLMRQREIATGIADSSAIDDLAQTAVVTPPVGYGRVRVDPTETTLAQAPPAGTQPSRGSSSVPPPDDARTASGEYKVKEYKVKFTPDLVQASGNYDSFYGVQGVMQFMFSDMLGDHQLYIASNLQLDLKNSDFFVSYGYLPERIDYGVDLFQNAQLLYIDGSELDGFQSMARFREYGATVHASNPFDRFSRLDAGVTWFNISREMLEQSVLADQSKTVLMPNVSYIFDNSTMWAFGPIDGTRYNFSASASPKLGESGIGFYTFTGDFRHYIPLGSEYSFAFRGSGGASFGSDPQRFFIGGMENWLNWDYGTRSLPIENAEDFTFLKPGYPMRGFNYNEQMGSKYFIGNLEFRFPLFRALITGPLPVLFQYVSGVMFVDMGSAWNDDFSAFRTDFNGATVTDDLLLGTGIGARAYVFGIPARLDVAWSYTLDSWSKPKYYLSLGYDF